MWMNTPDPHIHMRQSDVRIMNVHLIIEHKISHTLATVSNAEFKVISMYKTNCYCVIILPPSCTSFEPNRSVHKNLVRKMSKKDPLTKGNWQKQTYKCRIYSNLHWQMELSVRAFARIMCFLRPFFSGCCESYRQNGVMNKNVQGRKIMQSKLTGNIWFNGRQLFAAAEVWAPTKHFTNSTIEHPFMLILYERKTIASSMDYTYNLPGENAGQICVPFFMLLRTNKKCCRFFFVPMENSISMQVVTNLRKPIPGLW